jgi:hypothetical protein
MKRGSLFDEAQSSSRSSQSCLAISIGIQLLIDITLNGPAALRMTVLADPKAVA